MKLFASPYRFVQFALHWTSDFVRVYYDGILYRDYCSPDLPLLYNNPDVTMRIVLNNGVMDSFSANSECGDDKPFETATMFIDNIRVYQNM
jgi:hypothetical protein